MSQRRVKSEELKTVRIESVEANICCALSVCDSRIQQSGRHLYSYSKDYCICIVFVVSLTVGTLVPP